MDKIIALGAENKNTFSIISNGEIYVSDPVDTLTDINNYNEFEGKARAYMDNKKVVPDRIVCDLHPDYCSTSLALKMCNETDGSTLVKVQHHHAHIVSCMEDNGIDEEVIGISFDGTGYGSDGASWGGEFLMCTRKDFSRQYHLKYIPVPGGDTAAREIWRMALAYLYVVYGKALKDLDTPFLRRMDQNKTRVICQMMDKGINSPLSSSAGRLFDAVSSLIGICDTAEYEAEGAIMLERAAKKGIYSSYEYCIIEEKEIDVSGMIKGIVSDMECGTDGKKISAKFHNTVGEIIFDVVMRMYNTTCTDKVLISGGCFQNKYLVAYLEKKFKGSKVKLFRHKKYSTTDLGISVGQAVVAANIQ